jgi:hypothetical protein
VDYKVEVLHRGECPPVGNMFHEEKPVESILHEEKDELAGRDRDRLLFRCLAFKAPPVQVLKEHDPEPLLDLLANVFRAQAAHLANIDTNAQLQFISDSLNNRFLSFTVESLPGIRVNWQLRILPEKLVQMLEIEPRHNRPPFWQSPILACPHAMDSFQLGIRWNRRHG